MTDAKKHVSQAILRFRRKQKKRAIMKPSTFRNIEQQAASRGYRNPKAVAGKAYWSTVKSKAHKAGVY